MATSTSQRQSRTVRRNAPVSDSTNRYYGYRQSKAAAAVREYPTYRPNERPRREPSLRPPQEKSYQSDCKPAKKTAVKSHSAIQKKKAFRFFCRVGIVFAMCYLMIYRYAMILESNDKIAKLSDDLLAAEYNNQAIQAKIDRGLELSVLEDYATGQLGMIRPDNSQIFYVDIQLGNTAENTEDNSEKRALQGTPGALVHAIQVLK